MTARPVLFSIVMVGSAARPNGLTRLVVVHETSSEVFTGGFEHDNYLFIYFIYLGAAYSASRLS